jgi:chromosome partitioning protein
VHVVAVVNEKGGVGKTTTTVNLGAALAEIDGPVLLVDLDPHAGLTHALGFDPEQTRPGLVECLEAGRMVPGALRETSVPGVELFPARLGLVDVQARLTLKQEPYALKTLLRGLTRYPWVLIDGPPALGHLTINALAAASGVLIPVQAHVLALKALPALLEQVAALKRVNVNPRLRVLGVLPTMVEAHTTLGAEAVAELRRTFGREVFRVEIPKRIALAELPAREQKAITQAAPTSDLAELFRALAREVKKRAEGG